MPKFKRRDAYRGSWEEMDMKSAVDKVLSGELTVREAAAQYNVPRSTIQDRSKSLKNGSQVTLTARMGRYHKTFKDEYERLLANIIMDFDNQLMPLSKNEFLEVAYQLAEHLKLPHRFNKRKKTAGKAFYNGFMSRFPLLYHKSKSIPNISIFFQKLNNLYSRHSFPPSKIYNVNEIRVSCAQGNVTLLVCMSASGNFVPPAFIFPRLEMDNLLNDSPNGSIGFVQQTGQVTAQIFLQFLMHFVHFVCPSKEDPVLLITTAQSSHKDLTVITYAKNNSIHMLSIPPHTSHMLQPLDRTFITPFKIEYSESCAKWTRKNHQSEITEFEVAGLVNCAYTEVCGAEMAMNGFSCTGIYPINPYAYKSMELACSLTSFVKVEATSVSSSLEEDPGPSNCESLLTSSVEFEQSGEERQCKIDTNENLT